MSELMENTYCNRKTLSPGFAKLTPAEAAAVEEAERQIANGEYNKGFCALFYGFKSHRRHQKRGSFAEAELLFSSVQLRDPKVGN